MTKLFIILSLLLTVSVFANEGHLSQEQNRLDDEILSVIDSYDNVTEEELVELDDSLDSRIDSIEL